MGGCPETIYPSLTTWLHDPPNSYSSPSTLTFHHQGVEPLGTRATQQTRWTLSGVISGRGLGGT